MVKSALKDTKSNLTPPYSYPKSRDNGSSLFTATAGSMTLANGHEVVWALEAGKAFSPEWWCSPGIREAAASPCVEVFLGWVKSWLPSLVSVMILLPG